MKEEILKAIDTLIYLALGLFLIIFREQVGNTIIFLLGIYFLIKAAPNTFYFIKEYGGRKVWRKLFKK